MSETSNGMPDIAAGDNEPSMEDILSSIRKIIADDKSDESELAVQNENALQDSVEIADSSEEFFTGEDDVEQLSIDDFEIPEIKSDDDIAEMVSDKLEDNSDADEILELINLAEDSPAPIEASLPESDAVDELIADFDAESGVEPLTGEEDLVAFDESLDLVMDSDASDYLSADQLASKLDATAVSEENAALREEIESEYAKDELGVAETELEAELEAVLADDETELETVLADDDAEAFEESPSLDDDDEDVNDIFDRFDASTDDTEDLTAEFSDIEEDESSTELLNELDESNANAGDDQDMDLVKSLLADLMDEHDDTDLDFESTEIVDEDDEETADNILDEILHQSMEDEVSISESSEDSDFANFAKTVEDAAGSSISGTAEVSEEDKVVLPERTIKGRLSIGAKAAAVTAVVASTPATNATEDVVEEVEEEDDEFWSSDISEGDDDIEVFDDVENVADEELVEEIVEELEEITEEDFAVQSEEPTKELEQSQEEDTMVRAVKKKQAIVDEEIETESSEAFAQLTSVVREKADLEESGPPIGDLVQEALRPMLKEWLDKNLKGIVERAVTKEVKRISSGK